MKLLPIEACPFCGHVFSDSDRELVMEKLHETKESGEYVLEGYIMICKECDAEIKLSRKTTYDPLGDD